jgi:hypothetical protein
VDIVGGNADFTFASPQWKLIYNRRDTSISNIYETKFPQYRLYALLGNAPLTRTWTQGHTDLLIEALKVT